MTFLYSSKFDSIGALCGDTLGINKVCCCTNVQVFNDRKMNLGIRI